jgi:disulfide bond formation protein DsbB
MATSSGGSRRRGRAAEHPQERLSARRVLTEACSFHLCAADAAKNWRHFSAGGERFEERSRGRFATVRARMNYVAALAYDPARPSLLTVTVPNSRYRRLVVSRFERSDMTLAEEFVPALGPGLALAAEGRSLDEYVVVGLAVADGRLHALSAAFSTLLDIDLATREVTAARVLDGLSRPTGLALRDDAWLVLQEDGTVVAFPR